MDHLLQSNGFGFFFNDHRRVSVAMAYKFEVSTLSQLSGAPNPSRGDPLCFSPSCLWPHASPCISSSSLDRCGHFFFAAAAAGQLSGPVPFLCGSAAVCRLFPPPPHLEPAPPPHPQPPHPTLILIGAALCCPVFFLCGPAF